MPDANPSSTLEAAPELSCDFRWAVLEAAPELTANMALTVPGVTLVAAPVLDVSSPVGLCASLVASPTLSCAWPVYVSACVCEAAPSLSVGTLVTADAATWEDPASASIVGGPAMEIVEGSVTIDIRRSVERVCSFKAMDPTGSVATALEVPGVELTISRSGQTLGVFGRLDVSRGVPDMTVSVSGTDRAAGISADEFTVPYLLPLRNAARGWADVIAHILSEHGNPTIGFAHGVVRDETDVLAVELTGDPWAECRRLAEADGKRLFFDGDGIVQMERWADILGPASVVYAPGDSSSVSTFETDSTLDGVFNCVVSEYNVPDPVVDQTLADAIAWGNGPAIAYWEARVIAEQSAPSITSDVPWVAYDDEPSSPSCRAKVGTRTTTISLPGNPTLATAQAACAAKIVECRGRARKVGWTQIPVAQMGVNRIADLSAFGVDSLVRSESLIVPLGKTPLATVNSVDSLAGVAEQFIRALAPADPEPPALPKFSVSLGLSLETVLGVNERSYVAKAQMEFSDGTWVVPPNNHAVEIWGAAAVFVDGEWTLPDDAVWALYTNPLGLGSQLVTDALGACSVAIPVPELAEGPYYLRAQYAGGAWIHTYRDGDVPRYPAQNSGVLTVPPIEVVSSIDLSAEKIPRTGRLDERLKLTAHAQYSGGKRRPLIGSTPVTFWQSEHPLMPVETPAEDEPYTPPEVLPSDPWQPLGAGLCDTTGVATLTAPMFQSRTHSMSYKATIDQGGVKPAAESAVITVEPTPVSATIGLSNSASSNGYANVLTAHLQLSGGSVRPLVGGRTVQILYSPNPILPVQEGPEDEPLITPPAQTGTVPWSIVQSSVCKTDGTVTMGVNFRIPVSVTAPARYSPEIGDTVYSQRSDFPYTKNFGGHQQVTFPTNTKMSITKKQGPFTLDGYPCYYLDVTIGGKSYTLYWPAEGDARLGRETNPPPPPPTDTTVYGEAGYYKATYSGGAGIDACESAPVLVQDPSNIDRELPAPTVPNDVLTLDSDNNPAWKASAGGATLCRWESAGVTVGHLTCNIYLNVEETGSTVEAYIGRSPDESYTGVAFPLTTAWNGVSWVVFFLDFIGA
jgi:hypothetical protein